MNDKASPACKLILRSLRYKYKYFKKKGKLGADGSFFYDDKRLAREEGLSEKTVSRCVAWLNSSKCLKAERGKYKGQATRYWILEKGDKMSGIANYGKGDILTAKEDILVFKGGQNEEPNKLSCNELTNSINTEAIVKEDNPYKDNPRWSNPPTPAFRALKEKLKLSAKRN